LSNSMTDEGLALRLREVLKLTKTSQRDVCKELSVPYRTLQSYLSGKTRIPAVFLIELGMFLNLELDFIIADKFRPRTMESYDAIFQALDRVQLLPALGEPPQSEKAVKRAELASTVAATFRELYDRDCRDRLWLSKGKDNKDR
jgi:transcriptional regulator with XRE-family HTH domain